MHWQFGEMEFGEMKRNTSNWSNFGMLLRRAGLTASAGLSCTSLPTQYRLYGRRFLQIKRPNQQYQSTEGNATNDKSNNENNKIHICTDNNVHKEGYTQNKRNKSPSLH